MSVGALITLFFGISPVMCTWGLSGFNVWSPIVGYPIYYKVRGGKKDWIINFFYANIHLNENKKSC